MKAKKIYEFHKGEDPLKSLGVGIHSREAKEEIYRGLLKAGANDYTLERYKEDYDEMLENIYDIYVASEELNRLRIKTNNITIGKRGNLGITFNEVYRSGAYVASFLFLEDATKLVRYLTSLSSKSNFDSFQKRDNDIFKIFLDTYWVQNTENFTDWLKTLKRS